MPEPEPDEAAYVQVRLWTEAGAQHYAYWEQNGAWPETSPTTQQLVDNVLQYITPDVLPLTPVEAAQVAQYALDNPKFEGQLPPELRRGDVVFRSREHLVEGLNTLAPGTAAKIKGLAPDADSWGIELWAVGLGAGGVLVAIGKLKYLSKADPRAALISTVAGLLLLGAVAVMGLSTKTKEGKNVVAATVQALADAATAVGKKASQLVTGLIVAGTVALGVGLTIVVVRTVGKRRRIALER